MIQFFTIGVYGRTAEEFFGKLKDNKIDTFVDIRRIRGVRGAELSFVNSERLQKKLHEMGIQYLHVVDLSPTNEIRELQKEQDKKEGVATRKRDHLSEAFKREYLKQILDRYDLSVLLKQLEVLKTKRAVLFCVEKEAEACHRSLVAERLRKEYHTKVVHL